MEPTHKIEPKLEFNYLDYSAGVIFVKQRGENDQNIFMWKEEIFYYLLKLFAKLFIILL